MTTRTTSRTHLYALAALALMLVLPALVYYLWLSADHHQGVLFWPRAADLAALPGPTLTAVAIYGGWLLLQAALYWFLPGPVRLGTPLADGSRLPYCMNGWRALWVTLGLLLAAWALGWLPATLVADCLGPLLATVSLSAFGLSGFLYFLGKRAPDDGRPTGHAVLDYFLGTARNPRIGRFDFKFFCESRPGLIGWVVVNLSLAARQAQLHGTVSAPMLLVVALQFLYVADYFWHEEAILSTWDIKHENLGWMLCWGSLAWVPFTYSLQAQYLVHHPEELPHWALGAIVGLNLVGYWIFRASNLQKHRFRQAPDQAIWGRPPVYIRTARGTLLLASGWWGLARHMNYLGDWLMGLSWCLACGLSHSLPFFYTAYFAVLLIHRDRRDDALCLEKYGEDWKNYCKTVRWRLLPGVY